MHEEIRKILEKDAERKHVDVEYRMEMVRRWLSTNDKVLELLETGALRMDVFDESRVVLLGDELAPILPVEEKFKVGEWDDGEWVFPMYNEYHTIERAIIRAADEWKRYQMDLEAEKCGRKAALGEVQEAVQALSDALEHLAFLLDKGAEA